MRRLFFCSVVVLSTLSLEAYAKATAPITQVTLYAGIALIERSVDVSPEMHKLTLENLPANFNTSTLRVEADQGIRIGQIVVKDGSSKDGVHPTEKALQKKLQALKDDIEKLNIDIKAATIGVSYLENLGKSTSPTAQGAGAQVANIATQIDQSARQALQRQQVAEIKKRPLIDELNKVSFELDQFKNGTANTREISIQLAAQTTGKLRLYYQVTGAGWQPAYRAALDTQTGKVLVDRLAQIAQKTGEDWTGVKLKLSTGQPLAFREPVNANTRYVSHHTAPDARPMPVAAPAPMVGMVSHERRLDAAQKPEILPIIENPGNFTTEFEIPATVTLPADGRQVSVTISSQTLPTQTYIQVTPAIRKEGVLVSSFEPLSGVWLPGMIQLFRDGSFVGATRWNPMAEAKPTLGFGTDDLLRVTVNRKTLKESSAGFTGQRVLRETEDLYTLTNLHRQPVDVLVLESSPLAQSDAIEVKSQFTPTPTGKAWNDRAGVVFWKQRLAPNESLKLNVNYEIRYPKEGQTIGLP